MKTLRTTIWLSTGLLGLFALVAVPASADQVILDDLIVDGSICVGLDCVNGESFGFDTLRLKENNLRIKFQDTSTSASFPTRDWQITANDSSNGGAEKFSIDDIDGGRTPFTIEAGAPSHSLFVDDGGRIGLGTNTPVVEVHVKDGDTPTVRLEQDGSSGFTPQTWDLAGNETNFFIRDATNGSKLPFRIRPNAPSNSIFVDASDGDVGMGTSSPDEELHIATTDNGTIATPAGTYGLADAGVGGIGGWVGRADDTEIYMIAVEANNTAGFGTASASNLVLQTNSATRFTINQDNSMNTAVVGALFTAAGVWQDASSRKLKEHISDLEADAAFAALAELEPVTYNYIVAPNDPKVGFIAEDVPDLVATPERDGLSALDLIAVVTRVVQEQQKTIEALSAKIEELERP